MGVRIKNENEYREGPKSALRALGYSTLQWVGYVQGDIPDPPLSILEDRDLLETIQGQGMVSKTRPGTYQNGAYTHRTKNQLLESLRCMSEESRWRHIKNRENMKGMFKIYEDVGVRDQKRRSPVPPVTGEQSGKKR